MDYCVVETEEKIKREIMKNGPVTTIMPIYRDFLIYKDGLYEVQEGVPKFNNGHAIKVIGWGEENGTKFWLVENSWGANWGQNGVAKVKVGQEQLFLDQFALAPVPELPDQP